MSVEGKIVLIPGGSGGLGRTVVPAFTAAGARVFIADRGAASSHGENHVALKADVTNEADCRRLVEEVIRKEGRVDALVNLVGGFATGRLVETDASLWHRMVTMNLTAAFFLSKAVLPHMLERRTGRIVHMVARAAEDPFPGAAAYVTSKGGLAALIRALAMELADSGVTVNGVLPTTIDTPANRAAMPEADPAKWVQPKSIADLIEFLVSDRAGQLNGALIPVGA